MTTDDVQGLIRNRIDERERKAAELRAIFTFAAEMKELLIDFDPKLIYAEQDGRSIGKKPQDDPNSLDGDRLVQMHDSFEFIKSRMRKKR